MDTNAAKCNNMRINIPNKTKLVQQHAKQGCATTHVCLIFPGAVRKTCSTQMCSNIFEWDSANLNDAKSALTHPYQHEYSYQTLRLQEITLISPWYELAPQIHSAFASRNAGTVQPRRDKPLVFVARSGVVTMPTKRLPKLKTTPFTPLHSCFSITRFWSAPNLEIWSNKGTPYVAVCIRSKLELLCWV